MKKQNVIFEVLEATGLNWSVEKRPVKFDGNDGGQVVFPDVYATVRADNGTPLAVVKQQYEVLQNSELVETVYDAGAEVFNRDLSIEHPWNNAYTLGTFGNMAEGSLKEGLVAFVQMELPSRYIGQSDMKRFITATNVHGGAALGFGSSNQVICCANTFAIANREIGKIRHTSSMKLRVQEAVQAIRRILKFEEEQLRVFEKASNRPIMTKHLEEMLETVFGKDIKDPKVSAVTKNKVQEFKEDTITSISEQGETLWAIFNAVTRYTNHTRKVRGGDKTYSLMFGEDAKINQKAYNLLESWV